MFFNRSKYSDVEVGRDHDFIKVRGQSHQIFVALLKKPTGPPARLRSEGIRHRKGADCEASSF